MFYTFIVLFEKSSTLIDLMDLCKILLEKKKSNKPSLNGLGALQGMWSFITVKSKGPCPLSLSMSAVTMMVLEV
jgi:hypothetical protein